MSDQLHVATTLTAEKELSNPLDGPEAVWW